jgi:uncharacterized membrane protein
MRCFGSLRRRALGFALLAGTGGCAVEAGDSGTCGRTPALSYDNFGKGYLQQYCTGCHSSLVPESHREGATPGVDFDTYEGVLTWAERIDARATGNDPSMPPGGGPADDEVERLSEWLSCTVIPEAERWRAQ